MINGTFWLAIIILAPIICIYFVGANASLVFLSLCLGYVLYSFDTHTAHNLISSLHNGAIIQLKPSNIIINLALLLGPALLTLISQFHSLKGGRRVMNIVPAAFCGLFIALLITPVLPASVMGKIVTVSYWTKLVHYQSMVVGIGAATAIIFFWISFKHSLSSKKSKAKSQHT